jgi:hypothetical protein
VIWIADMSNVYSYRDNNAKFNLNYTGERWRLQQSEKPSNPHLFHEPFFDQEKTGSDPRISLVPLPQITMEVDSSFSIVNDGRDEVPANVEYESIHQIQFAIDLTPGGIIFLFFRLVFRRKNYFRVQKS